MKTKFKLTIMLLLFELGSYSQSTLIEIHREYLIEMQNEFRAFVREIQESYGQMGDIRSVLSENIENDNKDIKIDATNSDIPDIYPIKGTPLISSSYGYRTDPFTNKEALHEGIDIPVPENTDIVSCASGKVIISAYNKINGNYIIIDHNNKYQTCYGHLSGRLVKKGDKVQKGQIIGKSGNTGMSTGPHIHYQIFLNEKSINPISIIY